MVILMGLLHGVWVSVCRKNVGKRTLHIVGSSSPITCDSGAPLDLVDLVSIEMNEDRAILALLLALPSVFDW